MIALVKGYTALASLLLPKAFETGGYGISTIMLTISAVITTICACKLIDAGLKLKMYSYSQVVDKVLGRKGKIFLDVIIALTQWSFVISHITFLYLTFKGAIDNWTGTDSDPIYYIIGIVLIYTPISWVRNIAKFSFTFFLGVVLIMITLLVVTIYATTIIVDQHGKGPDIVFFNQSGWLTTMGTCIYCFEGIGVVMPIMQSCEDK